MNKSKSIVILTLVSVFIILVAVFAAIPTFQIGKSLIDYTGYARTIKLGLDMSGGVSAVFKVTEDPDAENLEQRIQGTVLSLQDLLVSKGYTEATVTTTQSGSANTHYIRVEVPDVDDPERVLSLIGRPATLEFKSKDDPAFKGEIVGKDHLESAYVTVDEAGKYVVALQFNELGTQAFKKFTTDNNGQTTYIYINGQKHSDVKVNQVIPDGKAVITGGGPNGYTYEEAQEFATQLQSGTFGVDLEVTETRNISPTLGANAVRVAMISAIVGVVLIFIFMAVAYRGLGLAANLALTIYVLLLLWFCAVLPWVQLTLPGIAGILLSIGMAVDANIIIFERIKDEYRHSNKPIETCIKTGFKRSTAAIIDGNVTTIIGAVVLWIVGSAAIVGFAVTLFIGILLSMFTSLVITRLIIKCFIPLNNTSEKFYGLKRAKDKDTDEQSEVNAEIVKEAK